MALLTSANDSEFQAIAYGTPARKTTARTTWSNDWYWSALCDAQVALA